MRLSALIPTVLAALALHVGVVAFVTDTVVSAEEDSVAFNCYVSGNTQCGADASGVLGFVNVG